MKKFVSWIVTIFSSALILLVACCSNDGGSENGMELEEEGTANSYAIQDGGVEERRIVQNGLEIKWFDNGQQKQEVNYQQGKKNGAYKTWHANGQLAKEGWMKDDKWDGTDKEWREDGTLRVEGNYLEGVQDGEWRFFDPAGRPLPTVSFSVGKEVTRELPSIGF